MIVNRVNIKILCFTFILLFIVFKLLLFYENSEKKMETDIQYLTEIKLLKHQLKNVTEYKDHVEQMLLATRKIQENENLRFKEMMESCAAIEQQSNICHSQFEDLKVECKKVKDTNIQLTKYMDKMKT